MEAGGITVKIACTKNCVKENENHIFLNVLEQKNWHARTVHCCECIVIKLL